MQAAYSPERLATHRRCLDLMRRSFTLNNYMTRGFVGRTAELTLLGRRLARVTEGGTGLAVAGSRGQSCRALQPDAGSCAGGRSVRGLADPGCCTVRLARA
jgi:hypothetical protein